MRTNEIVKDVSSLDQSCPRIFSPHKHGGTCTKLGPQYSIENISNKSIKCGAILYTISKFLLLLE